MKTFKEYLTETVADIKEFNYSLAKNNWTSFAADYNNISFARKVLNKFIKDHETADLINYINKIKDKIQTATGTEREILVALAAIKHRSEIKDEVIEPDLGKAKITQADAREVIQKFSKIPNIDNITKNIENNITKIEIKGSKISKNDEIKSKDDEPSKTTEVKDKVPETIKKEEPPETSSEEPPDDDEEENDDDEEENIIPQKGRVKYKKEEQEITDAIDRITKIKEQIKDKLQAAQADPSKKKLWFSTRKGYLRKIDKLLISAIKAKKGVISDPNDNSAISAANKAAIALIKAESEIVQLGLAQDIKQKDTLGTRIAGRFSDVDKAVKERLGRIKDTDVGRAVSKTKKALDRAETTVGIAADRKAKDIAQSALRAAKGSKLGQKASQVIDKVKTKIKEIPAKATSEKIPAKATSEKIPVKATSEKPVVLKDKISKSNKISKQLNPKASEKALETTNKALTKADYEKFQKEEEKKRNIKRKQEFKDKQLELA